MEDSSTPEARDEWAAEREAILAAGTPEELERARTRALGRQSRLTEALRRLGELPLAERRERGRVLNRVRAELEALVAERAAVLKAQATARRLAAERLDMTLPGRRPRIGHWHPVTQTRRRLEDVMLRLGFTLVSGPEIETEWYNFDALNMPASHPAREMHDTFFLPAGRLLRTHTSPVQIRAMQAAGGRLPVRVAALGFTYRRDDDPTHLPQFMQMEGLVVDHGIGMADLKGTLWAIAREVFGPHAEIRLRPSFFPFTEPSAEVDVTCAVCGGAGCRVCKQTGWLEVLGAGLVHPHVLRAGGYDPEVVSGFAFGWGVERVAMLLYGIDDLRLFYQNDWRFLSQF
ncbi:MAG: phenylalanine--tRNA ligase subunit alpha [Actinomycetia bacterium]|nr:phenylalanine--tRNA ligase subunit alpha [Actinomycetes bacterium]